jgi:aminoglycoside phosphotransferase (APT) family kinase protein
MEYMLAHVDMEDLSRSEDARARYPEIRADLQAEALNPIYSTPYRLIHNDLEKRNMIFTHDDPTLPLKLTGIIDWDYAYTGPAYYLFEYPAFVQDDDDYYKHHFKQNKRLRQHLVRSLLAHFEKGSDDWNTMRRCFRETNTRMNSFKRDFMDNTWDERCETEQVEDYLENREGGNDE